MKPVFSVLSFVLIVVSLCACSTSTTSAVVDDEEYSSAEDKSSSSKKVESSSSSQPEEKKSSSSIASSSSKKVESSSSSRTTQSSSSSEKAASIFDAVKETGSYTSKDSVAAYVCKFDKLPQNYVGKSEGQKLYESSTGNAFSKWNFNPWKTLGVMIGGDNFNNFASDPEYYHSTLPEGNYREADVDYGNATSRGTKRLVYQSGCVIYYTADHYESFSRINF
ncbi:MAG: hypothetical protein MJY87_03120 [Fibrobacter sp.]|nr:hypothetical protein [Fibrobacter sp.]